MVLSQHHYSFIEERGIDFVPDFIASIIRSHIEGVFSIPNDQKISTNNTILRAPASWAETKIDDGYACMHLYCTMMREIRTNIYLTIFKNSKDIARFDRFYAKMKQQYNGALDYWFIARTIHIDEALNLSGK